MDKLLPPRPLKWVVFILVVVVLAEVTGITAWVRGAIEGLKESLKGKS